MTSDPDLSVEPRHSPVFAKTEAIRDIMQLQGMLRGKDDTILHLETQLTALKRLCGAELKRRERAEAEAATQRTLVDQLRDTVTSLFQAAASDGSLISDLQERCVAVVEQLADQRRAAFEQVTSLREDLEKVDRQSEAYASLDELTQAYLHANKRLRILSPNYEGYEASSRLIASEAYDLERDVQSMRNSLEKAPEIYRPSEFWETFFNYNMRALRESGVSNFKLTVNQNYQNYVPTSIKDKKVLFLMRWFKENPSLRPLFSLIYNPDGVAREGYLSQPGTEIFKDDPYRLMIYKLLVTLAWEFVKTRDPLNLCSKVAEPLLGNPIRVLHDGKIISQDLTTSITEITSILLPLLERIGRDEAFSVLEIGGGYGRLAHTLIKTMKVSRYVIIDIPPALYVSSWYLQRLLPDKKFFNFRPFDRWSDVEKEANSADVLFLLPHQIELLPDGYVDASVAISSLHEMRLDQANNFLRQMARLSKHLIGSKQYWLYNNPYDNIVIRHEDYIRPDNFDRHSLESDALNATFFVEVLLRQAP